MTTTLEQLQEKARQELILLQLGTVDDSGVQIPCTREKYDEFLDSIVTEAFRAGYVEGIRTEGTKTKDGVGRYLLGYKDAQEAESRRYDGIFAWLFGEAGDFPNLAEKPHYRFRTELRKRLAALKSNQLP